jgi:hypothetical protein
MATLNLEKYDFSETNDSESTTPAKINPTLNLPDLNLSPQEPYVVSESSQEPQEEEADFSGLLQVKKPGRSNAVSSGYGNRKAPTKGASTFHDGIDIPLDINTPLKPFGNGEVFFAGIRKGYGKSVGIDYGNGVKVYLNHLNKTDVEVGDKVRPEAIIGLSGNTGTSTGPHVHIQAEKDGISIDPRKIFNEDPSKVGLALTIKGLLDDNNIIAESIKDDEADFSGLIQSSNNIEQQKVAIEEEPDFSGIAPTTENEQIDTDVLKFIPADKPNKVGYGQLFTEGFASHFGQMAKGIESLEKFQFKPRTANPNAPGKRVTFTIPSENGERPNNDTVNKELARVLGLSNLDNKFRKETNSPLIHLPSPDLKKNSDGTWRVDIEDGMTSGGVELVNAYARGGLKAFAAKRKELVDRIKVYQEDEQKQKQQFESLQAFRKAHPYLNLLINPTEPIKHGLEDAALSEIQLMHTFSMLPKALGISLTEGMDSDSYTKLIQKDREIQKQINEATAAIPKEETVFGSIPRAITSSVEALPRFQVMGGMGSWSLPTITYLEHLHQGNGEAIKAALPMAAMIGSMHGIEEAIAGGINPLSLLKKSEIANKDFITSISGEAPSNSHYLIQTLDPESKNKFIRLASEIIDLKRELGESTADIEGKLAAAEVIPKVIDFKAISPFQRQLVLRGTNALVNLGTTIATNPKADAQTFADSLFIGFALPVGKGGHGTTREIGRGFQEHGIINGDTYNLQDGSILLRAPTDEASGIMGRGITTRNSPYIPSIIEERANLGVPSSKQLTTPNVKTSTGVLLPIDQAALNLLALRRAYETGTYLTANPPQIAGKVGKLNVVIDQRKQDILQAIKILDEAIPKETQEYFAKNEQAILEAIATNYNSRIDKEEFVLGKKIIRKPKNQLSTEDVRPYNPNPNKSTETIKKSSIENFNQWARRTMVSVEESGKKGLENNKKNKGTFNSGVDPSDVPYLVQIGIGKLGRKALDAGEFLAEMVAEQGEEVRPFVNEIYKQSKDFVDGVNGLANVLSTNTNARYIANLGQIKSPPFPKADLDTIKNIYYIGSKYLKEAKEEDIPLNKVIATQVGVRTDTLLKFGEEGTDIARLTGRTDMIGNPEVPKAVKIGEDYYLFDGHHRSTTDKISGKLTIKGRVIDFNNIANYQTRNERAVEKFGETGKDNKWFTQDKQLEIRENFLSPPDSSQFNEGFTAAPQWIAKNASYLTQIVGFHVEDFYRRGIEPRLEEIVGRLRSEFGDWIDGISMDKWREFFNDSVKYYQSNNADPFFSQLKQNILEKFPEGNINAATAKNVIEKLGTAQEIEWTSGLKEFIDEKIKSGEKIKKQELIDFVNQNQVKVDEVVLNKNLTDQELARYNDLRNRTYVTESESTELDKLISKAKNTTRYDLKTYTAEKLELEGGENPREVLLKVPPKLPKESKEAWNNFKNFADELDNKYNAEDRNTKDIEEYATEEDIAKYNHLRDLMQEEVRNNLTAQGIGVDMYQTPHWNGANVVAHFRANSRTLVDGVTKVFHSEEFQSDWNQTERKQGYIGDESGRLKEIQAKVFESNPKLNAVDGLSWNDVNNVLGKDVADEWYKLAMIQPDEAFKVYNIPQNPFMENSWKELAFKRFLRMGVEDGADGVTWTTARQQQERYNKLLEGKVITIAQPKLDYPTFYINNKVIPDVKSFDAFEKLTNKEIRDKVEAEHNKVLDSIRSDSNETRYSKTNLGQTISVSNKYGTDYDTYFVNLAKKIGKKFGAKYELKEIETSSTHNLFDENNQFVRNINTIEKAERLARGHKDWSYELANSKKEKVHFLEITPQMRESILKEGLPTYGLPTQEPLKASTPIGIRNRLLTRDIFDTAKSEVVNSIKEITDNEGGTQTILNSGLNPDAFLDQVKLLYKGWDDFQAFSTSMLRKYGDKIYPHLEAIWNYVKEPIQKFNEDERGFLNFGKKKRLFSGEELDIFDDNRSSRFRRISMKAHRGIALAQIYEPFGQVYETLRGLQRTTNSYSTTILEQLSRSVSLLKKDVDQKVAKAIFARNKEGINSPAEDAAIVTRFGLDANQTTAYYHIRGAVSNVLDLRRDQILYKEHQNVAAINDELNSLGLPTGGTPINAQHVELLTKLADAHDKIQDIEEYFKELKDSGYVSLQRLGRYRAELENINEPVQILVIVRGKPTGKLKNNPDRWLVDYADSPEEAQARINEWKEQLNYTHRGRILDAKNPNDFREISRKLTPGEFEELVHGAGVGNTKEVEALRAEVYEKYPTMGYQLRRELYPGYRENSEFMIKSVAHQAEVYASSYYNNLGRQEGLKALDATGIETTDRDLWNITRQFIEDETASPQFNNMDRIAYKARKFTYLMQLGYQVKQLYLNAFVQPVTQNYNYLARIENPTTGRRLGGINEVERVFLKGTKLSLQLAKASGEAKLGIRKVRSSEFIEFESIYNQLKNERIIEPEYTKSLLELEAEKAGTIDRRYDKGLKHVWNTNEHWAGGFMRAGELTTRTQMAASLFVAGKKFGLAGDGLVDFIVRGIDATQTNPSRAENPYYVRKLGEVGKLFYQFGAFRHMWWENLALNAKSDFKHRSIAATSRTLAPLAIVGGISGLPLTGFAFSLYGLATGKNPDDRLRKWISNKLGDNDWLERMALYGVTQSAGFSQSAGIQAPVIDTLSEQLTQDSWWDKLLSSNVPALMTAKQIGQGLSLTAEGLYNRDYEKSMAGIVQSLPIAGSKPLRDINKAIQVTKSGYKTQAGDTILSRTKSNTTRVIFPQVLGVQPNEITEFYNRKRYKQLRKSALGKGVRRTLRKVF